METITLEIVTSLGLGEAEKRKARRFTNFHFAGQSDLNLSYEATPEHKQAHWEISAWHPVTILVDLNEKGEWTNIRIKENNP